MRITNIYNDALSEPEALFSITMQKNKGDEKQNWIIPLDFNQIYTIYFGG